jgi:hypothetical protein
MKKVYRTDIDGKPIVHGRTYWYLSNHIYQPQIHGEILWNKDILHHVFYPTNLDLDPLVVAFEFTATDEHWIVLSANDYRRAKSDKSDI